MREAPHYTVRELSARGILRVEDGNHGEYRPRKDEFVNSGVAFIRAADLGDGGIDFSAASKINETARARITKGIGQPRDVILSHKGTVGKVAIAPRDAPPFVCSPQTTFWRSLDEAVLDQEFLYMFIRSPGFRAQLDSRAGETDMAGYVSLTAQRTFLVPLPPINMQRDIVSCISSVDRKIELNRRMNETLEAMARAIFKDWFVDFGPTRAKAEGRKPYLAPELWNLFPATLDDDDKPMEWEFGSIGTLTKIRSGKRPPSKLSEPDNEHRVPVYGGNGISWYTNKYLYEPPFLITGRVGTLGTVFRIYESVWVSDNALCCFPVNRSAFELLYFYLNHLDYDSLNSGSTQPLLTQTTLKGQEIIISGQRVRDAFSGLVRPLFSRIAHSALENRTLAATRDLLLPKLMSGEIRLHQAEKAVEAVA